MILSDALDWAKSQLTEPNDADYLLCECINQSRSYLYTWPEKPLQPEQVKHYQDMIARRKEGEPVAYILKRKPFWTFSLMTSTHTLIPRPETELLVETVLATLDENNAKVCDLGTGTGAVALALASERKNWHLTGVDCICEAVSLANKNAVALNIENVNFKQSNWFSNLKGQQFNLIVSNPPYVENNSPYLTQGDVRYEPKSALTAGIDGLDDIRMIITQSGEYLLPNGWLMFEHGNTQHQSVAHYMKQAGYIDIQTVEDLNGFQRLTIGRRALTQTTNE